jgi:enamine deaminase RidA (YjgF/YER057c/UK114 family)
MAHLQYFNYAGYGETAKENYHYSQAVRVGDSIHCSGQGAGVLHTWSSHP